MPPELREFAHRNQAGEISLCAGIVAVVFCFVPMLGDVVALPAGLLAVVLGVVGVRRSERGLATNFGPSLVGATLGALSVFVVVLMFVVSTG